VGTLQWWLIAHNAMVSCKIEEIGMDIGFI
jgi:hypothetical protein